MKGATRNAIIAGAVTRISCRSISLDEAIRQTIAKHKATISIEAYDNLRRDVEAAIHVEWPGQVRQLEMSVGR